MKYFWRCEFMNVQDLLTLLQTAATLVCGGLALYFKFSTKAKTKAKEVQEVIAKITAQAVVYIKEAEDNYNLRLQPVLE